MCGFAEAKKNILLVLLLGVLLLLAYSPTFTGEFILDDRPLIKNNPYIVSPHSIISYLSQEDGAGEWKGPGESGTGYYRPFINFTYWVDYILWGMNGAGFRASNVIYHFLACILFFYLIRRLTGDWNAAAWGTILFALHPVNTEAVSWVSSRNNILVTIFGLASFHLYTLSERKERRGYAFLSLLLFSCALLSKEFGIALLPAFFLWIIIFSKQKGRISKAALYCLPFVIVLCAYLLLRNYVTGHQSYGGGEPFWRRILFTPFLLLANTSLILVPSHLHSFIVGYPSAMISWQTISGFSFVIFLGLVLWKGKTRPLFRFGLLSYLCALVPILNWVPLPSSSLVSMRWLYFPMIFLFIGVFSLPGQILRKRRVIGFAILCTLGAYFGFLTHVLNRDLWHDEEAFFNQEVRNFRNGYYSAGLAEILYQKGDRRGGEELFADAIRTGHATAKDLINYSALLIDEGRPDRAISILEETQSSRMAFEEMAELQNNLGMACFRLKRTEDAIMHFKKAVVFSPHRAVFWANLGGAYGSAADYGNAAVAFRKGMEAEPGSLLLRKGLALTLMKMHDYANAVSVLEKVPGTGGDRETESLIEECRGKLRRPSAGQPGVVP